MFYKVSFCLSNAWKHKSEGIVNITVVVQADTQFSALSVAWERLNAPVAFTLPEPVSMSAEKCEE